MHVLSGVRFSIRAWRWQNDSRLTVLKKDKQKYDDIPVPTSYDDIEIFGDLHNM